MVRISAHLRAGILLILLGPRQYLFGDNSVLKQVQSVSYTIIIVKRNLIKQFFITEKI